MSPEQAEGELAGPRADVYSLALTLYECWAGTTRSPGDARRDRAPDRRADRRRCAPRRPDLPEGLADTIDACLEPDPELRPTRSELARVPARPSCRRSTRSTCSPGRRCGDEDACSAELGARSRRWPRRAARRPRRPARRPGLALVAALLAPPSLIAGAAGRCRPVGAVVGAARVAPRRRSAPRPTARARAALGRVAWCWMLVRAALALGLRLRTSGSPTPAPDGWSRRGARRGHVLGRCSRSVLLGAGGLRRRLGRARLGARARATAPLALARRDDLGGRRSIAALAAGRRRRPRRPARGRRDRRRGRGRARVRLLRAAPTRRPRPPSADRVAAAALAAARLSRACARTRLSRRDSVGFRLSPVRGYAAPACPRETEPSASYAISKRGSRASSKACSAVPSPRRSSRSRSRASWPRRWTRTGPPRSRASTCPTSTRSGSRPRTTSGSRATSARSRRSSPPTCSSTPAATTTRC